MTDVIVYPKAAVDTGLAAKLDVTAAAATLGLRRTAVKTAAYTAVAGDLIPVDCSSADVTITLPNDPVDGALVGVKVVAQNSTSAHTATVACAGTAVLTKAGGSTSTILTILDSLAVSTTGASVGTLYKYDKTLAIWTAVATDLPLTQLQALLALKADAGNVVDPASFAAHTSGGHSVHPYVVMEDALTGWPTTRPSALKCVLCARSNSSTAPTWMIFPDTMELPSGSVVPAFVYQSTFEGWTAGATLTNATVTGSGDPIETVSPGTNSTATITTVTGGTGDTKAAKLASTSSASAVTDFLVAQGTSLQAGLTQYVIAARFAMPALATSTTFPSGNVTLLRFRDTTQTTKGRAAIRYNIAGNFFQVVDSASLNPKPTSATGHLGIAAGELFWLELWWKYDGTNSYAQAKVIKGDGTSEIIGDLTTAGTYGSTINVWEAGIMSTVTGAFELDVLELRAQTSSWPT